MIPKGLVFFSGRAEFMWHLDFRYVRARAMATTTRGACRHLLLPHLHRVAHQAPRRSRKRRSRRWFVAWPRHPARQMPVVLVVALLVVCASETETAGTDEIASTKGW
jgi:hypothetical protein